MFLSEYKSRGSYGCIIKPGLNCYDPEKNSVSKLFSDKNEWISEKESNELIKSIDKNNNFTIKMLNSCKIESNYINKNVKGIQECTLIRYSEPIYQIIYEDGGYDLRYLFYHDYIYVKYPEITINKFFKKFLNIFEGVLLLSSNNLCHRDIKLDNILFNGEKISLIDFGLMVKSDKVYDDEELRMYLNNNIYYYPNDLKLYSLLKLDIKSFKYDLKLNSRELDRLIYRYLSINREKMDKDNLKILTDFIKLLEEKSNEYLNYFKETYVKAGNSIDLQKFQKVDIYSLGLVLLELLISISVFYGNKYKIDINLIDLIYKMMNPDPYKRINIEDAVESYRQIINDY